MIISPVRGNFTIVQDFGANPKIYKQFGLKGHNGQDLDVPMATPLYSPIDGVCNVKKEKTGYGLHVSIFGFPFNEEGDYREILLAHFSKIVVANGDSIKAGDLLGYSGNSGYSFFDGKEYPNGGGYAHLHWSMRTRYKGGNVINYDNGYFGSIDIFRKSRIIENELSKY